MVWDCVFEARFDKYVKFGSVDNLRASSPDFFQKSLFVFFLYLLDSVVTAYLILLANFGTYVTEASLMNFHRCHAAIRKKSTFKNGSPMSFWLLQICIAY